MTIKKQNSDDANPVPREVTDFFRLLNRILIDSTPESESLLSEISYALGNIHHRRFDKIEPLYSAAAYIDQLSRFLLGKHEKGQVPYGLMMVEALFYDMAVNANHLQYLPADYALYASATALALENLLRRCEISGEVPTVFIATTQTPGELVFGNREREHKSHPNWVGTRFDEVNNNYRIRFRDLVSNYMESRQEGLPLLIERHVFARRKFTEAKGKPIMTETESLTQDESIRFLDYYLESVETNPEVYGPNIQALDEGKFKRWIQENHACSLPGHNAGSGEYMARIQWFEEPSLNGGLKWWRYEVVTDLIVFGSSKSVSLSAGDKSPKLYGRNINWEFGLQYIDLGGKSEGRAVKPLYRDELDGRINFLGFKHYKLREFIRSLQEGPEQDNPLGLTTSGYIVRESPWKDLWAGEQPRASGVGACSYGSCFISYSHEDSGLAATLREALISNGVECRMDSYDIRIGENVKKTIYKHIAECDRVVVCLSKNSLASEWIEYEIKTALLKQTRHADAGLVLIPLNLDDAIRDWDHALAPDVGALNQINFVGWSDSKDVFAAGVSKLLESLSM
jgi:hypothetical protein